MISLKTQIHQQTTFKCSSKIILSHLFLLEKRESPDDTLKTSIRRHSLNTNLSPHDVHEHTPLPFNLPQGHGTRFWDSFPDFPWQTEAVFLLCDWLQHSLDILSANSRVKVLNNSQLLPWAQPLIYYTPSSQLPVCVPRQQVARAHGVRGRS